MEGDYWNEVWLPYQEENWIDHHKYLISNYGRVRSLFTEPNEGVLINGGKLNGYLTIYAKTTNGKQISRYIHKIVGTLFIEKKEGQLFVIHKDYDKLNNRVTNLAWASRAEQSEHQKNNPVILKRKETPANSKLTPELVRIIKRRINDPNRKTRMKMIAKQYGISEMQLWRIKSGENWGHIEE